MNEHNYKQLLWAMLEFLYLINFNFVTSKDFDFLVLINH